MDMSWDTFWDIQSIESPMINVLAVFLCFSEGKLLVRSEHLQNESSLDF